MVAASGIEMLLDWLREALPLSEIVGEGVRAVYVWLKEVLAVVVQVGLLLGVLDALLVRVWEKVTVRERVVRVGE